MSSQERKYSSSSSSPRSSPEDDWNLAASQDNAPPLEEVRLKERSHKGENDDNDYNGGSPVPSLSDDSSVGSVGPHPSLPLERNFSNTIPKTSLSGIRAPLANSPQHTQTSDTDPDPIEEVLVPDRKDTPESEEVAVSKVSPEPDDFTIPHTELIFEEFTVRRETARARASHDPELYFRIPFSLLGAKFDLRVYPSKSPAGGVGFYLEKTDSVQVSAIFRVVVFHKDVYAEAMEKVKSKGVEVTFNGVLPVLSPALTESLASNDTRNASIEHFEMHEFITNNDFGFANLIPASKRTEEFALGPRDQKKDFLLIRIFMQRRARKSMCRSLATFSKNNVAVTKQWPFVGLNNQGATCYMNSYLQTLFYLPVVRSFVYAIPVHPDQMQMLLAGGGGSSYSAASALNSLRSPSPGTNSSTSSATTPSVSQALQFLFYQLQTAPKSVSTEALTASFGWGRADAFEQHDVQEFSRKLLEHLEETAKKQSPPLPIITKLFEGKQQSYIECTNVSFTSKRTEEYLDLSLNVVNMPTLLDSLKDYVAEEMLTGPNQYRAKSDKVDHGPQDARKGIRILEFPPLLQLQLKRFTYDMMSGDMTKVDSKFAFPDVLDLTEFEAVDADEEDKDNGQEEKKQAEPKSKTNNGPPIYFLHSVLVHRGSMKGGHYYAYVKPFPADRRIPYENAPWFKFDDETVSICGTSAEAIEKNYGEMYTEVRKCLGKTFAHDIKLSGSAYMLIYVRKNFVETGGMDPHAITPSHLVSADSFVESKEDVEMADASAAPLLPLAKQNSLMTEPQEAEADQGPALPTDFCDTPDDLDSFIDLLRPQPVPLPQHIEDGIQEANRARLKADEEAAALARRITINIIAEPKLIFRGLKSSTNSQGQAGVAGLKFQVAPFPSDSTTMPLTSFSFSGKSDSYTFQKSDSLASIREQMEKEYGIPVARQQYWLFDQQTQQPSLYIMQHGLSLETIGGNPQGNATFFLRDADDIDSVPNLSALTHNAGVMPTVPSHPLQLERSPFGNQDRRLLLLKFFDVHTQMMYYIGSVVVFTVMSEAEFKYFVTELLKHKGIDIELRNRARRAIIESYPSFIQNLPTLADEASKLPSHPSVQLTDVFAKAAEAAPANATAATDASAVPQVTEHLANKLAYDEEDRWSQYKLRAEKGDPSVSDITLSAIYIQSEAQLSSEPQRVNPVFASSSSSVFRSKADHINSLTKPDPAPNPNPFSFSDHSAFTSVQKALWKPGTVLIIYEALPTEMKACVQSLWEQRTAVITNAPMEDSEPHATFQMPAELDLFAPLLHPLPLPPRESTFSSPKDYVHHLAHRAVVEFCPAITNPDTGEVVAFDRTLFQNHPFAQLESFAMELDVDMPVQEMLRRMVEALKERILPDVWGKYFQLRDLKYYKLWHQAAIRNDQPFVTSGDILSGRAYDVESLYDLNVAQVILKGNPLEKASAIQKFKVNSMGAGTSTSVLFFELLSIPLETLFTHWWLTYRYVNEKGECITIPSDFPDLWPEKAFLVEKGKQSTLTSTHQQFVKEMLFPNRHEFGLDQYRFKCDKVVLRDAPRPTADSDKMSDADGGSTNSHKRELPAADCPDSTQASKKMKIDTGSIVTSTREAIDCTDSPILATPMPEISEHSVYHGIYTPNPVNVSVNDITNNTWMLYPVSQPLRLFYHRWRASYSLDSAIETITKHYAEALPVLKAASDVAAPSQDNHRTFPRMKTLKTKVFTQPVPLPFYFHCIQLDGGDGTFHMWIPRFTTPGATLTNNTTYALSPLPPIYYLIRAGESFQHVREQVAKHLGKQPSELQFARLKPSSYDVFPEDDDAAANQFMNEIISGIDNPKSLLALHDTVSPHTSTFSGLDRGGARPGSAMRKSAEFNISRNA